MLGRRGQILEGASSNLFIVKDGKVRTPEAQPGILMGITRATVLAVAAVEGVGVDEAEVRPEDLYGADEAFVTGTFGALTPVTEIDGRTIGNGGPGSMTARLQELYDEAVAADVAAR